MGKIEVRPAWESDKEAILQIIAQAQAFLRKQGVDQWQNGYPNRQAIEMDIKNGIGCIAIMGEELAAYAAISFDGEPTYDIVYGGSWRMKPDAAYGVIHRLAAGERFRRTGAAAALLSFAEKCCRENGAESIRIDTHADNLPMQRFLRKHGFVACGRIKLLDGGWRIAFEKLL